MNSRPQVPFAALSRQHEALRGELRSAFDRVLGAGAFINGVEVEAFEAAFADYCRVGECVGVASGTAALSLTLLAAGIGPGDEVVVPAHTFISTALAVLHAGASPVFCDVDRASGLLDLDQAAAVIGGRTAAIVPVHLYGQVCDMDGVCELARRHGLFVLEDAAQAHGATHRGRRAGGLGDAAAFSFYPSKNLGALGDGGAVCTDDEQLAARLRELRHLGQRRKGEHVRVGYNSRLDALQAALLSVKLPHLDDWNAARRRHAGRLREQLAGTGLELLHEREESPCIYHLFPVRHPERDRLAGVLGAAGIEVGFHYTPAAHDHPAFAGLPDSARPRPLPQAEAWAEQELTLPMFAELSEEEVDRIARSCQGF